MSRPPLIGIIAEDLTDRLAIGILVRRIAEADRRRTIAIKSRGGHGCGHLERKAKAHMADFASRKCVAVVVVRDLDRNSRTGQLHDENDLRARLEGIAVPQGLERLICIPVEELEAWFWSDQRVIDHVCRAKNKAKASTSPQQISKPKERLVAASIDAKARPRYSTSDNEGLAKMLDLNICAKRCKAFADLRAFIGKVV